MRRSYDVINRLTTTKYVSCTAFIPVSIGTRIIEIHQNTRKLWSKTKWHLFTDHRVEGSKLSS